MHRCVPRRRWLLAATAAVLPAWAQDTPPRHFPATALRGELQVQLPPAALLNGQPTRLAPGARIRGRNNLLLLQGQLSGERVAVHYTLDSLGQLLDVWLLTPAELARRPWPSTTEQASRWTFNADAQTWSPR
jgi:hypothetical protein